jgi:hypothetical protein
MGSFGQNIERSGYIGKSKNPEFKLSGQGNAGQSSEKSLKKEMGENSTEKANLLSLLLDEMGRKLNIPENFIIIDEAVGEEDASIGLAKSMRQYAEKIGNQYIVPNNSLKDILLNEDTIILGRVDRVKKKGLLKDSDKAIIKAEFEFLREYIDLLNENKTFGNEELKRKFGFLGGKINEKQLELLRRNDKEKFLKINKELL